MSDNLAAENSIQNVHLQEFNYSTDKLYENFSNYSAFHYRSIYIHSFITLNNENESNESKSESERIIEILTKEYELIENAIFTEPDDQSAWWYYRYILQLSLKYSNKNESLNKWYLITINNQYDLVKNLLGIEECCKWGMLLLIDISKLLIDSKTIQINDEMNESNENNESIEELLNYRKSLLLMLINNDNMHIKRYQYLLFLNHK